MRSGECFFIAQSNLGHAGPDQRAAQLRERGEIFTERVRSFVCSPVRLEGGCLASLPTHAPPNRIGEKSFKSVLKTSARIKLIGILKRCKTKMKKKRGKNTYWLVEQIPPPSLPLMIAILLSPSDWAKKADFGH